ncbi:hypothetical protein LXL04_017484 [Taraxacum kok-saghyz]
MVSQTQVTATATLHREIDELTVIENALKKTSQCVNHKKDVSFTNTMKQQKILDLQQKLQWQKQEIRHLKEKSLWNRSFDTITSLLSKSIFTILARIKLVFNITHGYPYPSSLPRSLSASATVYPSDQTSNSFNFVFRPLHQKLKTSGKQPPLTRIGLPSLVCKRLPSLVYKRLCVIYERVSCYVPLILENSPTHPLFVF